MTHASMPARLNRPTIDRIGHGHFLHAARSTVVPAETLLHRRRAGGCFDPEEICTLAQIEPRLRAVGVTVVSQPA